MADLRHLRTKLVGVTFSNDDGSSRQALIARCQPGERLTLRHEPDNPKDENAVAVYNAIGQQLGHLRRELAREVVQCARTGHRWAAYVSEVTGGYGVKRSRGCNVVLVKAEPGVSAEGIDRYAQEILAAESQAFARIDIEVGPAPRPELEQRGAWLSRVIIMAAIIGAVAFVLAIVGRVSAEEPTGYRDLSWGTDTATVSRQGYGCYGRYPSSGPGGHSTECRAAHLEIGNRRFDVLLNFLSDRLTGYALTSRQAADYAELRDAAIAKFGAAHSSSERIYQNVFGATFSGDILAWKWASGATATHQERCGSLDAACLTVRSPEWYRARREAERERRVRKPAF